MIAFVRGPVVDMEDDTVIIDVGGVGLQISVPGAMLEPRPVIGEELLLHTHLQIKDDGWQLYGFSDREQLAVFRLLISVSGVGAKTGLAIIDRLRIGAIVAAVGAGDETAFTAVSGVGKKTAQRLLLELKDKFAGFTPEGNLEPPAPPEAALNQDLLRALKQLGYTATECRAFALQAQNALSPDAGEEDLLREALKIAMRS